MSSLEHLCLRHEYSIINSIISGPVISLLLGCVSLKESQLAFSNLVKSRSREIGLKSCWMAL